MRKIYTLFASAAAVCFMAGGCKKTQHPTNPTPDNYRLMSYSRVTNGNQESENFTFSYDSKGRVSQIITTSNFEPNVQGGVHGTRAVFAYDDTSGDRYYRTLSNLRTGAFIERDTFVRNTSGQIITAYMPGRTLNFEYFGKLLSRITETYYSGLTTISYERFYTSDNKDFLSLKFTGDIKLSYSTAYTKPFYISWTFLEPKGDTVKETTQDYTITYKNYKEGLISATVEDDAEPAHISYVGIPHFIHKQEDYGVFPDKEMRIGDYRQIESFTLYGQNIYQGAHLTKSITNEEYTTNITYDIDADSKIKNTTAVFFDRTGKHFSSIYEFQYETF